jgi:hypothetical protein
MHQTAQGRVAVRVLSWRNVCHGGCVGQSQLDCRKLHSDTWSTAQEKALPSLSEQLLSLGVERIEFLIKTFFGTLARVNGAPSGRR